VRLLTARGAGTAAEGTAQQHRLPQAVPTLAATAEAKDFPIIVRGLGTVEAFNTVTVKSRVDGNIEKIGYQKGEYVHKGDLLVQIDPRPHQAQLAQAEANKAKDEANLENAKRDLARLRRIAQRQFGGNTAAVRNAAGDRSTPSSDGAGGPRRKSIPLNSTLPMAR